MSKRYLWLLFSGLFFAFLALILAVMNPVQATAEESVKSIGSAGRELVKEGLMPDYIAGDKVLGTYHASAQQELQAECAIYAVDLIGAWVDSGAEEGQFPFMSTDGEECTGEFEADILPLFTAEGAWFEGSEACTNCHFDNSEDSRHEMDLSSYAGIMTGGDVLSKPPGEPIIVPGDWEGSKLMARLRNNRMPPNWEFDIEEGNRDGPLLELDGGEIYAVELIEAWVDEGTEDGPFTWIDLDGAEHEADFTVDVLPLFTTDGVWFEGSEACTNCHFDNSEDSRHEMDLSSYAGIMTGGDVLSKPPGEPIVESGDWENSKLQARLRNNRMPPGWVFDIEETNRDGPVVMAGVLGEMAPSVLDGDCSIYAVELIGAWTDAGAEEGTFNFTSIEGESCTGNFEEDILPLFTTEGAWFAGSEACTNCHFDNSEDSRHEMDLSSYAGIMTGGDVLSKPPGEPIIVPGDWEGSKLMARLRNNRMPPNWEFDIEEGNRDGPLLELDGGEIYAVELIGAWVDEGTEDGPFTWIDLDGAEHEADFTADVLPLFTTDGAWFEGSEACTNCHFDNSEDSRHEMDLSSYAGIMTGGDVLSKPPGEPIVESGDWENSKLQARLRNNRMPPGWVFDIEETNRDGPMVSAGVLAEEGGVGQTGEPTTPSKPLLPDPTTTQSTETTVSEPETAHIFLVILAGILLVFAVIIAFAYAGRTFKPDSNADGIAKATDIGVFIFAILAVLLSGLVLYAVTTDAFTKTVTAETTINQEIPYAVELAPAIPIISEVRLEEWQARIPDEYSGQSNPFAEDPAAAETGREVFQANDCADCHGLDLKGTGNLSQGLTPKPVDLTDPGLMSLPFVTDDYLYWRISDGGAQAPFLSAMPAFRHIISEDERWQLVSFVRSQTGDEVVDEGEQAAIAVIEKGGCFACHHVDALARGGRIGPLWEDTAANAGERIAGMSPEEYLHQSILDPSSFIVPGFEEASAMTPNFSEILTPEEIDILVEFILHLAEETGESK